MPQLNELRKELRFNSDLLSLVETLKNIAGSQYHVMEKQKERFDEFMDAFSGFFRVVNLVSVTHPLVAASSDVLGILIITSDSGFMGGLNKNVINAGMELAEKLPEDKVSLMIIGDKGGGRFTDMGRKFKFFPGIGQETIYEQAVEVKNYIVNEVLEGRMGKVVVAYPKSLSFSAQDIEVINLLPCAGLFDVDSDSEIGKRVDGEGFIAASHKVIVESSYADMVEYLASTWVVSRLFVVFEDSKLAEYSARAMHLEGSMSKIEEEHGKIKHRVFKASHELIDKGMRECFAAKNIKEKKKKKKKVSRIKNEKRLAAEEAAEEAAKEVAEQAA